jgi:hypothetical protein
MAGMRPFVLSRQHGSAYCRYWRPDGCLAIAQASAVPLWKVIVGPRVDELQTGPQGVRFLLHPRQRDLRRNGTLGRDIAGALAQAPDPN